MSTQCTSHYPVVAATRVVLVYFYAPLFRHASPTRNKDVIAIQFRDGTTGSDFLRRYMLFARLPFLIND